MHEEDDITTTSADGTTIACRTTGTGTGVLVVPGPLEWAADLDDLATALADEFTVHVLDRRGRGGSGPCRAGHDLGTEVEDVRAVLAATGARRLVGISSGAVIALQVALRVPGITHVVAYEPPIGATGREGLDRFTAVRSKVLLVGGARSPRYLTDGVHALAKLLPHAEKVLLDEAHHFTPSENPELLRPAFAGFLGS